MFEILCISIGILIGIFTTILLVIFGNILHHMAELLEPPVAERFPPLSDAQYLALFPPGTNPDVALRVRATLVECLNVDADRIYPSSRLVQDLGAE